VTGSRPAPVPLAPAAATAGPGGPGQDEITLAAPPGRCLCHAREHRKLGTLAEVIVTFGELGTGWRDALWRECWGRSFAMCGLCWEQTRTLATARLPCLVIRDTRPAPPDAGR
jgi:hypothetical protein